MSTKAQPATTTTSSNSGPWGPAQPYLQNVMGTAAQYLGNGVGNGIYNGPTQADLSSQSQQALQMTQDVANGQGGLLGQSGVGLANNVIGAGNTGLDQLKNTANGQFLTPDTNPYLASVLDAANRRTADATNGQFSAAGRYGSGAHTDVLSRNIGEQNNSAYMQNYNQERANQLSAASTLNNSALNTAMNGQQITNQLYSPAQMLAGVGQAYDDRAQNQLNSNIDKFNQQQQMPWQQLAQANAIYSGAGQLGSSGTSTQVKPGQTSLQTLLGYGTAGAGLLGKLF